MRARLELATPAKINLFLRIVGRRSDGYHELDSVFVPVSLFDRITIVAQPAPHPAIVLRSNWPDLPSDRRNLAVRAAQAFMEKSGRAMRLEIDLFKQIPAGAGLGGGSSDAGAVLRMLARICPMADPVLAEVALAIGADVPFFLSPRLARVRGIGERITYLESVLPLHLVIAVPPITVATAAVYGALRGQDWSGPAPAATETVLANAEIAPQMLINDLEKPATALFPVIHQTELLLKELGALGAVMSGSGGSVLGIFSGSRQSAAAAQALARRAPALKCYAVKSLAVSPQVIQTQEC